MTRYLGLHLPKVFSFFIPLSLFVAGVVFVPYLLYPEKQALALGPSQAALRPGEVLAYDISWSRMLSAGTAVMEVRENTLPDGRKGLDLILTGKSRGIIDKLYPVNDRVKSVFDPEQMHSLSFQMYESVGKRKRYKSLTFDWSQNTVVSACNNDLPQTVSVPEQVQDGLSSLYYLRTMNDFTVGKVFAIDVHDSGKNWSIQVLTLGRERVSTPAGEFNTIKVRTRPLYNGVYQNKGEIFLWLTDDSRKVPVLLKSTIKVGSFVFTLKGMRPGKARTEQAAAPQHLALEQGMQKKERVN